MIEKLHVLDGSPRLINFANVDRAHLESMTYAEPAHDDAATEIHFLDGTSITVMEPIDQVYELINPEAQAGC